MIEVKYKLGWYCRTSVDEFFSKDKAVVVKNWISTGVNSLENVLNVDELKRVRNILVDDLKIKTTFLAVLGGAMGVAGGLYLSGLYGDAEKLQNFALFLAVPYSGICYHFYPRKSQLEAGSNRLDALDSLIDKSNKQ